jgi:protein TonB
MIRPFTSFAIAFLLWFFLLGIFSYTVFKKAELPPVSLTIDATMVSEIAQEKKSVKNFTPKEIGQEKSEPKKTAKNSSSKAQKTAPLFSPLPEIPDDLRDEAFSSFAVARFFIASDGSVTNVELLQPCANPRLNKLLLNSLKSWKFVSNSQSYFQDIRVNFEVK